MLGSDRLPMFPLSILERGAKGDRTARHRDFSVPLPHLFWGSKVEQETTLTPDPFPKKNGEGEPEKTSKLGSVLSP